MFSFNQRAQSYLTIASFLSTARKQGIDSFEALNSAFNGKTEIVLGEDLSSYVILNVISEWFSGITDYVKMYIQLPQTFSLSKSYFKEQMQC